MACISATSATAFYPTPYWMGYGAAPAPQAAGPAWNNSTSSSLSGALGETQSAASTSRPPSRPRPDQVAAGARTPVARPPSRPQSGQAGNRTQGPSSLANFPLRPPSHQHASGIQGPSSAVNSVSRPPSRQQTPGAQTAVPRPPSAQQPTTETSGMEAPPSVIGSANALNSVNNDHSETSRQQRQQTNRPRLDQMLMVSAVTTRMISSCSCAHRIIQGLTDEQLAGAFKKATQMVAAALAAGSQAAEDPVLYGEGSAAGTPTGLTSLQMVEALRAEVIRRRDIQRARQGQNPTATGGNPTPSAPADQPSRPPASGQRSAHVATHGTAGQAGAQHYQDALRVDALGAHASTSTFRPADPPSGTRDPQAQRLETTRGGMPQMVHGNWLQEASARGAIPNMASGPNRGSGPPGASGSTYGGSLSSQPMPTAAPVVPPDQQQAQAGAFSSGIPTPSAGAAPATSARWTAPLLPTMRETNGTSTTPQGMAAPKPIPLVDKRSLARDILRSLGRPKARAPYNPLSPHRPSVDKRKRAGVNDGAPESDADSGTPSKKQRKDEAARRTGARDEIDATFLDSASSTAHTPLGSTPSPIPAVPHPEQALQAPSADVVLSSSDHAIKPQSVIGITKAYANLQVSSTAPTSSVGPAGGHMSSSTVGPDGGHLADHTEVGNEVKEEVPLTVPFVSWMASTAPSNVASNAGTLQPGSSTKAALTPQNALTAAATSLMSALSSRSTQAMGNGLPKPPAAVVPAAVVAAASSPTPLFLPSSSPDIPPQSDSSEVASVFSEAEPASPRKRKRRLMAYVLMPQTPESVKAWLKRDKQRRDCSAASLALRGKEREIIIVDDSDEEVGGSTIPIGEQARTLLVNPSEGAT